MLTKDWKRFRVLSVKIEKKRPCYGQKRSAHPWSPLTLPLCFHTTSSNEFLTTLASHSVKFLCTSYLGSLLEGPEVSLVFLEFQPLPIPHTLYTIMKLFCFESSDVKTNHMLNQLFSLNPEGNCNPLQYSCLENLMDRGAWRVHGVIKSRTRLNNLTINIFKQSLNSFLHYLTETVWDSNDSFLSLKPKLLLKPKVLIV